MSSPAAPQGRVCDGTGGRSMRITSVETIALRAPLAREFRGSYYRMTHRATVITRVHTEDGITGEAYVGDEDASLTQLQAITSTEIAPRLVGLDAFTIENIWLAGYRSTFDILRDRRLGLVALAGVDTAIWDAVGKALQIPLWKLWGAARDRVPMIAIGGYYDDLDIADEMSQLRKLGLAGVKFKVGGRSPA